MLGARVAQCSRSAASTSRAAIHSSATVQANHKLKARVAAAANLEKRAERARQAALNRPHVVLGHRPGDEAKWNNCDLAKVLVTEKDILASPALPPSRPRSDAVPLPEYTNYGVHGEEKEKLFEALPALSAEWWTAKQMEVAKVDVQNMSEADMKKVNAWHEKSEQYEKYKAGLLARVVDLRNANARGIAYENRQRCIAAFSEPGKPNDTGRPEVQAAILTMRIRNVWEHLMRSKKDVANRRSLRHLIHQRAKILKYLKRVDQDRYDAVLERLGLEPQSVEGELLV